MAKFTLLSSFAALTYLTAVTASQHNNLIGNQVNADTTKEGSQNNSPTDTTSTSTSTPVLCSQELNAYCPPNTTCCPKYSKSSSSSSRSQRKVADGDGIFSIVGYSCLMSWSSRFPQGPCCSGDNDVDVHDNDPSKEESKFGSGCAAGYICATPSNTTSSFLQELKKSNDDDEKGLAQGPHCQRDEAAHPVDKRGHPIENDYERMPRYRTCPAFAKEDIAAPHGLPIPLSAASYDKSNVGRRRMKERGEGGGSYSISMGQLAYFTNMGPLVTSSHSSPSHKDVKTAVVGIHGSGRDAGSYLCAMIAAADDVSSSSEMLEQKLEDLEEMDNDKELDLDLSNLMSSNLRHGRRVQDDSEDTNTKTTHPKSNQILVIAPWFLAPADGKPASSSPLPFLQWVDDAPIAHTFRYGAESIGETATSSTISSYGAMDVLLETLCDKQNYPNLERIVVAGHSAGGQFVHRWGLSSDSWCFGDGEEKKNDNVAEDNDALPSVRLVAANPRSYAYLDKRRYLPATAVATTTEDMPLEEELSGETETLSPFDKLEFRSPTSSERDDCQEYNRYCWGLEDNPDLPAPYIIDNVDKLIVTNKDDDSGDYDGNTELFLRYASRDVLYLSGERDTKQLGDQICHEDGYQGPSRRERSERFYASLQVRGEEIVSNCRRKDGMGDEGKEELVIGETRQSKGGFCARQFEGEKMQVHDRSVVKNVGHDHALIFQSAEGREGMFSDPSL